MASHTLILEQDESKLRPKVSNSLARDILKLIHSRAIKDKLTLLELSVALAKVQHGVLLELQFTQYEVVNDGPGEQVPGTGA